jgi:hypothetical protein
MNYKKICILFTLSISLSGCGIGTAYLIADQQNSNKYEDSRKAYKRMNCSQLRAEYNKENKRARSIVGAILPVPDRSDLKRTDIELEMESKGCRMPA